MDIDVGIGPLPAQLTYTAAWIFPPISGMHPQRAVDLVNQALLELLLGGIQFDAAAPEDVGEGHVYHTGYFMAVGGLVGGKGPNFSMLQNLQAGDVSTYDSISLFQPRSYTAAQINAALAAGRSIAQHAPELNPSVVLDGLTALGNRRATSSLIFLWTAVETLLVSLWGSLVTLKGAGILGRKAFIEGRGWTAAHKAEVLYQLNAFDEVLYGRINQVRKARNEVAHSGQAPDLELCAVAADVMFSLLSLVVPEASAQVVLDLAAAYRTHTNVPKPEPVAWRHFPAVPGNERWGDADYPRYPEREWVPLGPEVIAELKGRPLSKGKGRTGHKRS
jgi:hypothetical protein